MKHTIQVRPSFYKIPSGERSVEPVGYCVEFYRDGHYVESRHYTYLTIDEFTMSARIINWVRNGQL